MNILQLLKNKEAHNRSIGYITGQGKGVVELDGEFYSFSEFTNLYPINPDKVEYSINREHLKGFNCDTTREWMK